MDLVFGLAELPGPGQTVLASALHSEPGGKGGNQAVACARQGAQVHLLGRLGNDANGATLRAELERDGIDHSAVLTDPEAPTGLAAITVEASGQNRIVVVPGANARFTLDAPALQSLLTRASALVMQLESPMPEVLAAAQCAHKAGRRVVFNPSPIQPLPEALLPLDLGPGRRPALLLIGSADTGRFNPAQGTDLLRFFGQAFRLVLLSWLRQ